jgi:hypothetical protein
MTRLSCRDTRRELAAYHDEELPLETRVSLESHLERCAECRDRAVCLDALGAALREAASVRRSVLGPRESVQASVLARIAAERHFGFAMRVGRLQEDLHVVWAVVGATAATTACAVLALAVLTFGSPRRADSLAGILEVLASPGSNENPVRPDPPLTFPRLTAIAIPAGGLGSLRPGQEDDVFLVSAVITREGQLIELQGLRMTDRTRDDASQLLHAAAGARFQPARLGPTAVAVNVVWIMAHTTVRASHS